MTHRARSLITGSYFPKSVSDKIAKLNLSTNFWLSEKELDSAGLRLKNGEVDKYFSYAVDGNLIRLYNVCQTIQPAKILSLLGRLSPRKLFSDIPLAPSVSEKLTSNVSSYESSDWITEEQLKSLALEIKNKAKAVIINDPSEKPSSMLKFYNVAELQEPGVLAEMERMFPISATTGSFYKIPEALTILKFAVANNYRSPFWITAKLVRELKLSIKNPEKALIFTPAGAENTIKLYNSTETNDPKKVIGHALEQSFLHSGVRREHFL